MHTFKVKSPTSPHEDGEADADVDTDVEVWLEIVEDALEESWLDEDNTVNEVDKVTAGLKEASVLEIDEVLVATLEG